MFRTLPTDQLPRITIAILVLASPCLQAAERIEGRVVDSGLSEPNDGIAGVKVTLVNRAANKVLQERITDANGRYTFEFTAPFKAQLVGLFSKPKYYADPALLEITRKATPQAVVALSQQGQTADYYKQWAERFLKVRASDPDQLTTFYVAIASLPPADKESVYANVRQQDVTAWESLKTVDDAFTWVDLTSKEIRGGKPGIHVLPWIDAEGYGRIYGNTGSTKDKQAIEKLVTANQTEKVRWQQGDVVVRN